MVLWCDESRRDVRVLGAGPFGGQWFAQTDTTDLGDEGMDGGHGLHGTKVIAADFTAPASKLMVAEQPAAAAMRSISASAKSAPAAP